MQVIQDILTGIIAIFLAALVTKAAIKFFNKKAGLVRKKIAHNLRDIKTRLYLPKHHPVVASLVSNLLRRSIVHITETGEWISLEEYLKLLEESLVECNKEIFATSLLPPDVWLTGKLNKNYRRYFEKQKNRIQHCPNLKIKRVFILDKEDFPTNPRLDPVIGEHLKAGMEVGLIDRDLLSKFDPSFVRDFVLYEDELGKWIIDAGTDLSETEEKWLYVRVVDDPGIINAYYTSLISRLDGDAEWYKT
jgi:hypothetical protein